MTISEIQAALNHPRDIQGFRIALDEAIEALRRREPGALDRLDTTLRTWSLIAADATTDPEGRARMYHLIDEINARYERGEPSPYPARSAAEIIAQLGLLREE